MRQQHLWKAGDRILSAVSGGPDSVALLRLLAEVAPSCSLRIEVVHVNHGLRGAESDEDARFVARLCERLEIPCHQERLDPMEGSLGRRGRSLQEWAREARYAVFERMAAARGVDRIALGHTADDQAETLLMWMLRGAGTRGMAGIPAARQPWVIRPLLTMSRAELLAYLEAQGQDFRIDSTNAKPLYLRNRVRQNILPALKQVNPSLVQVLARQADILGEEDRCLEAWTASALTPLTRMQQGDLVIDRAGLLALPLAIQRRAMRTMICRASGAVKGPSFRGVAALLDRVLHGRSGSVLTLHGVEVLRDYETLRFHPVGSTGQAGSVLHKPGTKHGKGLPFQLSVAVPSKVHWPLTDQVMEFLVQSPPDPSLRSWAKGTNTRALLDMDRFTPDLMLRTWLPGDAFCPVGMGGRRKKLQDYFMDLKLPRRHRGLVPILVAPEGILWVGGYRADHRVAASAASSRLLLVELKNPSVDKGA